MVKYFHFYDIKRMKTKNLAVATVVAAAIVGIATIGMSNLQAYAQTDPQRNNFGEGAKHLGSTGQMGTHSQDGGEAGTHPYTTDPTTNLPDDPGRLGIGTIGHPADVADFLCPPGSSDPRCPPS
jgi:hypothetical protein